MILRTKAETLLELKDKLESAKVLPVFLIRAKDWKKNRNKIVQEISQESWATEKLIVRSSALNEDSETESMAGKYESILNVDIGVNLNDAVDEVFHSFGEFNGDDICFIQPMLPTVKRSGVCFTRDPSNSAHYYVINFDDTSGKTDTVTGGMAGDLKTLLVAKTINEPPKEQWVNSLINLCRELEKKYATQNLDIEFGFDEYENLYLFQVRPLILKTCEEISLEKQYTILRQIKNKVASLSKPFPYLAGKKSILGVMPDWNPAEIIGVRPRPFALSLYKEFITDGVWAESRSRYGYRNLRGFPLLIDLGGIPFIDVRASFNSFVPKSLDKKIADKLIEYYITQLEKDPRNHDKVEFEVIFSCYTFDLDKRLRVLLKNGFSKSEIAEIKKSLLDLTNNVIHGQNGMWKQDEKLISELIDRQSEILNSSLNEIEKMYWLTEDCKRYGTLPFAGLARAGFIAVTMLKSLVREGFLEETDYHDFLNSLEVVNSQMANDLQCADKKDFLKKYGHLRPGTYDILSDRYDQSPDKYFTFGERKDPSEIKNSKASFGLSLQKMNKIKELIEEHQIDQDVVDLFNFFKGAIEGREYSKFIFTKSLSEVMRLFESLGEKFNFSKDDISYADISIVKRLYSSTERYVPSMNDSIMRGRKRYSLVTQNTTLPPLIVSPEDVEIFYLPEEEPNYITLKKTTSEIINIVEGDKIKLRGKILMIPNADPGFDWIFTHEISGFITMYGGVNSHMAIRAQELGIPAVIGAGELLYKRWEKAHTLSIDCANKQVQIIK